ncbi:MAG: ATP-binding cassette domain-containing protein [Sedimenticolaceae bacterium]|nr:ATP-binding cassette domain-containing protein [Sedimenticolaceae bacterium]
MPSLKFEAIATSHLDSVSLDISEGETVALHGQSGSGKSLLLRAIADLDEHSGEASLDETRCSSMPAPEWRRRVGYLPAETHWWAALVGEHFHERDSALVTALGLPAEVFEWEVSRLSTGEKQRLGIARLLDNRPDALLLDEPTANLDPEHTSKAEAVIRHYQAECGCPVLWVSHSPEQRHRIADRIFRIEQRRLVEEPL